MLTARQRDELRERDREARTAKVYDSPGMKKLREAERGPKQTPASAMAARHSEETGREQAEDARETRRLLDQQLDERNRKLQTGAPLPADLDKRHERARNDLQAKHAQKRAAREDRHMIERDQLRRSGR